MIRKIAAATAMALTVVACALALWSMREAVQLLLASLVVSSALSPLIASLHRRGLAYSHAITLAFLAVFGTLLVGALLLGAQIVTDLGLVLERGPLWYDRMRQSLINGADWAPLLGQALPTSSALIGALLRADLTQFGLVAASAVTQVLVLILLLIGAASLGFYWLADQQQIERLWLSLLPLHLRTTARAIWIEAYAAVGLYLRHELVTVGVSTLLLVAVYGLLEVPGASLLALAGGLVQVVPVMGVPLAVLLGVLVAATQGWDTALFTLGAVLTALSVTHVVVRPRLLKAGPSINPVLVIVLIMALAELAGIWAILFAAPLAAAVQAAIQAMRAEHGYTIPNPTTVKALDFQQRLDKAAAQIEAAAEPAPRLRDLLGRARKLVGEYARLQSGR